jgi:chemotaxis protein CheC
MTKAPLIVLSELELDALTELVNLGVSQAAASLARMVKEEVTLSVPRVTLVSREEAVVMMSEENVRNLLAVHQIFDGDIAGRALLIFPEAKSLELVRAVVGGELSLEEITELEQEALAEIGNVILNGCLATMANMLERSLSISLPEIIQGSAKDFFNLEPPPEGGAMVMFIYINFSVSQRDISGYIAMMMDMPSLVSLQVLLREFIRRST